jgi:hypothetical protein
MELPQAPVGGLSALDADNVGNTVDDVSRETTKAAGHVGGKTADKAATGATKTVGKAAKATKPIAKKATAGPAGGLVGGATKGGLPTDALTGGGLPTSSLGGLPLGG